MQVIEARKRVLGQEHPSTLTSVLGAGRTNPFRMYPIDADLYEHRLVDHYKNLAFLSVGEEDSILEL